jgi:hypothetical protein
MNFEYKITDMKRVPIDGTVIKVSCAIIATEKEKYFIDAPEGTELFGQKLSGEKHYNSENHIFIDIFM